MKLFINNKRIKFISNSKSIKNKAFDLILDANDPFDTNKAFGKILITNGTDEKIASFIKILELKKLSAITCISFLVPDKTLAEKAIKKQFKVIKAAGGVVLKNGKLLLIHRLGVWDFPKGKLESGEAASDGALREVEEECNVKVVLEEKLCSTWHTYTAKDKRILKKTSWYIMHCTDDNGMKPQLEEDIDEVAWMSYKEAKKAFKSGGYESIKYVLKKFNKASKYLEI